MLLKLKDWPPSSDIAEYMPKRFNNLFDSFPLPGKSKIDSKYSGDLNNKRIVLYSGRRLFDQ